MKYCVKCGTQIEEGALFCPNCGVKFDTLKKVPKGDMNESKDSTENNNINDNNKKKSVKTKVPIYWKIIIILLYSATVWAMGDIMTIYATDGFAANSLTLMASFFYRLNMTFIGSVWLISIFIVSNTGIVFLCINRPSVTFWCSLILPVTELMGIVAAISPSLKWDGRTTTLLRVDSSFYLVLLGTIIVPVLCFIVKRETEKRNKSLL